jgi:crotonobetainyl-CoA:carnitine CoA-transferase CaiB-like acyl-CoA transferase
VRVLDITSVVMGPLATQILGDLGAEVISIESERGDTNRHMGPRAAKDLSDVSLNLLRNKRNVALDLRHPAGREAALAIAATCDVVVTNLRPAPLARLRLGYEDVLRVRPDVVFCRAQGFPTDSPHADEPAYDDIIQAAAGVSDVVARAGGEPALVPTLLGDKVSGLVIAYAVLAALVHRERTGQGQLVEVPMLDALASFLLVEHSAGAFSASGEPAGYHRILTPSRGPKRTADGWVMVFPYLGAHWNTLVREVGLDELVDDPRLRPMGRGDTEFAYGVLERVLAQRPTDTWLALCAAEGIPATAVASIEGLLASYPEATHPSAGAYRVIPSPARFSATPTTLRRPAPHIGQHTREVLAEVGYDEGTIEQLAADGVLRERGRGAS